ncbi:MAG: isoaspartyl peptidase/L-asparaginase family protein [Flavobacteriaceae bacterium]
MKTRRDFLKITTISSLALAAYPKSLRAQSSNVIKPLMISTWNHGMQANAAGWEILSNGGSALDAVEQGARVVESDPKVTSVGYGGRPDREGYVTLDACIMDDDSSCGSVMCLEEIEHPISVARKVMENTPHVILNGQGAQEFAVDQGFEKKNLLTPESKKAWEKWKKDSQYKTEVNVENHDTIGLLAMDENGKIAGACTTSGMAYKMRGRVGDSPIIGAGLFIDNEVGGCTATGMGEAIVRIAGSATVVELMRSGMHPQEACEKAIARIVKKHKDLKDLQVGFLAMDMQGRVGAYSVYQGFNYALTTSKQNELIDAKYTR